MGRRSAIGSLVSAIARAQRANAAAHNRAVRDHARAVREHTRAVRQAERAQAKHNREMEREAKRQYLEDQLEEAEDQTAALAATIDAIDAVLSHTLDVDDSISFDSLRLPTTYPPFEPPAHLIRSMPKPDRDAYLAWVRPPGFFSRLLPGAEARYREALRVAEARYDAAMTGHEAAERARIAALNAAREIYDAQKAQAVAQAQERNVEIDEFESSYVRGDVDSILAYNTMVLERSDYPVEMPQAFGLEYDSVTRALMIDSELPDDTIIPSTAEVRYVKSKDTFEEKPRKASEVRARHQKLVAAIALRTVHEVFEADRVNHVHSVTFSGFVNTIDPATGQKTRQYLIAIRAGRPEFGAVDLARVDPTVCVRKFALRIQSQRSADAPMQLR